MFIIVLYHIHSKNQKLEIDSDAQWGLKDSCFSSLYLMILMFAFADFQVVCQILIFVFLLIWGFLIDCFVEVN